MENLDIGNHVMIQNGQGNSPLKWEKNGVVVSIEGYDKYGIWVNSSCCLTYRNRKHLRKFTPFYLDPDVSDGFANSNFAKDDNVYTKYQRLLNNDSDAIHTNSEIRKLDPFDRQFEKVEQNTGCLNTELRQNNIENVPINNNMYYNDDVNMPRHSERHNKGTNERLRADYEMYDVSYCYACKCKLGASATKYPTLCDFCGGDS